MVCQNRPGFKDQLGKDLINKLLYSNPNFVIDAKGIPSRFGQFIIKINTVSHDKELSKNRHTDTLEKQTLFSSQYTEFVTEYGLSLIHI